MAVYKIVRVRRDIRKSKGFVLRSPEILHNHIEAANPAEAFRKFRDLSPTMASVPLTDLEAMETP